eukprot:s1367_g2.t1
MTVIQPTASGTDALVLPHWLALTFSALIIGGLAYAYRGHGIKGVVAICAQVLAITFVQLSTKLVQQNGFAYPSFIALVHFSSVWLVTHFLALREADWTLYLSDKENRWPSPGRPGFGRFSNLWVGKPFSMFGVFTTYYRFRVKHAINQGIGQPQEALCKDATWYAKRILPIAVLQTANVVMNTTSLKYIGAGFNSIIGILTPVMTALVSAALGRSFASMAWLGIVA